MELLGYTLQQLINGLQLGAVYALIALGYTMVYGVLRLINFAHGDIFMFGTFVGYFCIARWHLPIYLVFMISIGACAALGVLVEKIAYKPLRAAPRI
jgi:branched-chain amino acid transport system permease protein